MVLEKIKFEKHPKPVLSPKKDSWWERYATYNPAAVVKDDKVYLFYRAEHTRENYISKIGLATSTDGFNFKRESPEPILEPSCELEIRGLEDPRAVKIDDNYYLAPSPWDGKVTRITLAKAISEDLTKWERLDSCLFHERPSIKHGCLFQEKIDGKYMMYFRDSNHGISLASSTDLKDWEIKKDSIIEPRDCGFFDSRTVSPATPPIILDNHIILFYIGSDMVCPTQSRLKDDFHEYGLGAILFNKDDPTKVIERTGVPLMRPEFDWERLGKVNNVIYPTGLVKFKDKYFLYYGAADNVIGVATTQLDDIFK